MIKQRRLRRFNWLAMMVRKNEFTIGVEVGAAIGITTDFLLKNCPTLKSLTVVDLWEPVKGSGTFDREDMEELFRNKFEHDSRITILKGLSWEMADNIANGSLDFAFIDADHSYDSVMKDIEVWYPKVREGGLFCGHDLHFPGVAKATKKIFGSRLKEAGIDHVWYVKV